MALHGKLSAALLQQYRETKELGTDFDGAANDIYDMHMCALDLEQATDGLADAVEAVEDAAADGFAELDICGDVTLDAKRADPLNAKLTKVAAYIDARTGEVKKGWERIADAFRKLPGELYDEQADTDTMVDRLCFALARTGDLWGLLSAIEESMPAPDDANPPTLEQYIKSAVDYVRGLSTGTDADADTLAKELAKVRAERDALARERDDLALRLTTLGSQMGLSSTLALRLQKIAQGKAAPLDKGALDNLIKALSVGL
uniref:Uncharacterized protein n=1 Tax=uncultured Caudovirales phage TaxID=2100421 RepID=A0A6J5L2U5_9CAUD|nr:hypothetical protein UFOVP114_94 [uncultured Caudovirales phage]